MGSKNTTKPQGASPEDGDEPTQRLQQQFYDSVTEELELQESEFWREINAIGLAKGSRRTEIHKCQEELAELEHHHIAENERESRRVKQLRVRYQASMKQLRELRAHVSKDLRSQQTEETSRPIPLESSATTPKTKKRPLSAEIKVGDESDNQDDSSGSGGQKKRKTPNGLWPHSFKC